MPFQLYGCRELVKFWWIVAAFVETRGRRRSLSYDSRICFAVSLSIVFDCLIFLSVSVFPGVVWVGVVVLVVVASVGFSRSSWCPPQQPCSFFGVRCWTVLQRSPRCLFGGCFGFARISHVSLQLAFACLLDNSSFSKTSVFATPCCV